jgi:hypothetical protein
MGSDKNLIDSTWSTVCWVVFGGDHVHSGVCPPVTWKGTGSPNRDPRLERGQKKKIVFLLLSSAIALLPTTSMQRESSIIMRWWRCVTFSFPALTVQIGSSNDKVIGALSSQLDKAQRLVLRKVVFIML